MDKKEFRKKWVEALRSGKYKPGRKRLCRDGAYCCLGVACDLYNKLNPENPLPTSVMADGAIRYGYNDVYLPSIVQKSLGMSNFMGQYIDSQGYEGNLAHDNDLGFSFLRIAEIIESEPEGLFVKETDHG
jgi:hypothetical protein